MISGLSRKLGIVALFDRGVEGVAVDMGDARAIEFVVGHAGAASRNPGSAPAGSRPSLVCQAIPAEELESLPWLSPPG